MKDFIFPESFEWGVATSAFQIEGARAERGDSVWDDFCTKSGAIRDGSDGNIACDHYRRYREDVAIMKELNVDCYRFSLSWPRILPQGTGAVNEKGLDFYDRLTDELIAKGITPYATLFHWDLPLPLHEKGGWLNSASADWFYEYAQTIGKRLGDRIQNFITFNEPQCFIPYGYRMGVHAPGFKLSTKETLYAMHNVLRAHGAGVAALRQTAPSARIGVAMASDADYPLTDSPLDIQAAKRVLLSLKEGENNWLTNIVHWDDPIYFGDYPKESYERFGDLMPVMSKEDSALISQKIDFHGQNCYSGSPVESDGKGGFRRAELPLGYPKNALNWLVCPRAIWFVTKCLYERYHMPIYITENGICCNDWVHEDGRVHDFARVDFYKKYLKELKRSIDEGTDIRGYFAWSFMDNFEWADGYSERFGLVYVDYATQKRTIKDSGYFYRDLINANKGRKHL